MAHVDVTVETIIERPRSVVATYAAEPDNATAWYVNIKGVQWKTPRPLGVRSQFEFTAAFLGRTLTYTYEVVEFEWSDVTTDSTLMRLRNRGEPSGFSALAAPLMARAIKRANTNDLERLKAILESTGQR